MSYSSAITYNYSYTAIYVCNIVTYTETYQRYRTDAIA